MSEDTSKTKTLSLSGSGKLSLGGVDSPPRRGSEVSARRGKTVQVEVRRKRPPANQIQRTPPVVKQASSPPSPVSSADELDNEPENQLQDGLTATERANRMAVLKQGIKRSELPNFEQNNQQESLAKETVLNKDIEKLYAKESEKTEDPLSVRRRAELEELKEIEAQAKAKKEEELSKIEAQKLRQSKAYTPNTDVGQDFPQARRSNELPTNRRKREEDIELPRRAPGRNRDGNTRRQ